MKSELVALLFFIAIQLISALLKYRWKVFFVHLHLLSFSQQNFEWFWFWTRSLCTPRVLLKSASVPVAPLRKPSSMCAAKRSSRRCHRWKFLHQWRRDAAERRAGCSSLNLFDPTDRSIHTHRKDTFESVKCFYTFLILRLSMHGVLSMHILPTVYCTYCMHIYSTVCSTYGYKLTLLNELLPWGSSV